MTRVVTQFLYDKIPNFFTHAGQSFFGQLLQVVWIVDIGKVFIFHLNGIYVYLTGAYILFDGCLFSILFVLFAFVISRVISRALARVRTKNMQSYIFFLISPNFTPILSCRLCKIK